MVDTILSNLGVTAPRLSTRFYPKDEPLDVPDLEDWNSSKSDIEGNWILIDKDEFINGLKTFNNNSWVFYVEFKYHYLKFINKANSCILRNMRIIRSKKGYYVKPDFFKTYFESLNA